MSDTGPPTDEATDSRVLRLIDASLNRAAEGARVVEDYTRFVLDDRTLTEVAKQLRHAIGAAAGGFCLEARLAVRDTAQDVGTQFTLPSEACRESAADVATASLERLQQALRSLEEYAKTWPGGQASCFEQLRYDAYCLAKAIAATARGQERLSNARLYVLVDGHDSAEQFGELVSSLCEAGVDALQLRDKQLTDRKLLDRARQLVGITADHQTLAIVNDRPDIARLARADGVHVGQDELSVSEARTILGPEGLIGVSTHTPEQLAQAIADGASYVGLGPTFPSATKAFDAFPGLDYLRHAAAATSLPAFAIGGIGEANLDEVLATGIRRIAVASTITADNDPVAAARRLRARLDATEAPQ